MGSLNKPILNGRYQLTDIIGRGGMAVVYRAEDLTLQRPVALKVLRPAFTRSEEFRRRFESEARSAARLSHANIVTVHDFGADGDNLFIVMEYVDGSDLRTILKQRSPLPLDEALDYAIQACAGLGFAHKNGIVHCDIKPHNMLITGDHRLKVADFGIAHAFATAVESEPNEIVWGSPLYFSPEQASGQQPIPASDVYSTGIVLYEMVCGRLPFLSEDPTELAGCHRETIPPAPRRLNRNIPPALELALLKVLEKQPTRRYRTADQFGQILTAIRRQLKEQPFINQSTKTTAPANVYISESSLKRMSESPTRVESLPLVQPIKTKQEYAPGNSANFYPPAWPAGLDARKPGSNPLNPALKITGFPDEGETEIKNPPEGFWGAITGIDWPTVLLGLLTLLFAGGLAPFWMYIIFTLRTPVN